jgi:hypothetical protein
MAVTSRNSFLGYCRHIDFYADQSTSHSDALSVFMVRYVGSCHYKDREFEILGVAIVLYCTVFASGIFIQVASVGWKPSSRFVLQWDIL